MSGFGSGGAGSVPFGSAEEEASEETTLRIPGARARVDKAEEDALGVDFDAFDGLPFTFALARGAKNLANALARRYQTRLGFLADAFNGDPDYGRDIIGRLNTAWSVAELADAQAELEDETRKDERVDAAVVTVTHDMATSTMTLDVEVETAAGPFRFVFALSSAAVELVALE